MYNSKITPTKNTGLWIDRKHCILIHFTNESESEIIKIDSSIEGQPRVDGEGKEFTRMGKQYMNHEGTKEETLKHELRLYFTDIASELHTTKNLFICGPAQTRIELAKYLNTFSYRPFKIIHNQALDSMSDKQLAAKFKEEFNLV